MDGKGFFLGVIAAIVLFLLWKKEQVLSIPTPNVIQPPASPGAGVGCSGGCGTSPQKPSYVVSGPIVSGGGDGFVTPGTPPLNNPTGGGSFYGPTGPTPDTGFTSFPIVPSPIFGTPAATNNVAGSPTTPATNVPARAVQTVDSYGTLGGFQQRWNYVGIPRPTAENLTVN